MTKKELQLAKAQLNMLKAFPENYKRALSMGCFCAGFGGDLNGVEVPQTLISGVLPPNVSPEQMFNQIIQFMEATIRKAELEQRAAETLPSANV